MKKTRLPDPQNRRRVFRLRLPSKSLLKATIDGNVYDVVEVAEYSVWVTTKDVGDTNGICKGILHWSNGETSKFTGNPGPIRDNGRIILNVTGIAMQDIVGEQRRLIIRYPLAQQQKRA